MPALRTISARGPHMTHAAGWIVLALLAFLQAPGRTAADTKFDLTADAGAFLAEATHAYTDRFTLGQMQNQAYGYLFPHGAFFWLTEPLPDWVAQRIWWTIVMGTAFSGAVVLGRRVGLKGASISVAAVLYALSPRVLTTLTAISSEAWPVALVPWTLAPLFAPQLRRGDVAAAVIPVALMGAVNATATIMACLPAFVLLIYRFAWKPLAGWLLGAAAVSAWWIGPLLVLGRYSPPFTDFIESAYVTTRWTNLAEVLRGTTSWAPFVDTERTAGHLLVAEPVFVLFTLAVAALGLAGLALRGMPWRGYFVVLLCLGVALLAAAHGPLGTAWLSLLDGPAAPFRNLHKLDPLVRLPLALGAGYALSRARTPAVVAGVLVTVLATSPAWTLRLAPEGTWTAVSSDWEAAADFIEANAAHTRTLVVPEAQFARQTWGWTRDEPIQGLTSTRFAARDAVPLVDPEAIRGLDGQMAALSPEAMRALGVGAVVVRDDLASGHSAPALYESLGEGFGEGFGEPERFGDISVYLIDPHRDMMIASASPTDLPTVAGGGEVLPLLDREFGYTPRTVTSGERADIITDTPALAKRNYGTLTGPSSAHLRDLSEGGEIRNRVTDYPSDARRVRVTETGGVVRASSSAADATAFGGARPAESLTAAVDGLDGTAWHPTPGDRSPWIEVAPESPVESVTVTATDDVAATVSWPGGSREVQLRADEPVAVGIGGDGPVRVVLDKPAGISTLDAGVDRIVNVTGTGDTYFFQRLLPADDVIRRSFTTDRAGTWELSTAASIDGEDHEAGPVELPAGAHTLVTEAETVSLSRTQQRADWSPFSGTVEASDTDQLILTTRSFNPGLRGTVAGTSVEPVRVDSGMQAFHVPAGAQGEFTMTFAGETFFRASLIFGGALSLLALGLCVLWCNAPRPGNRRQRESGLAVSAAAAVAVVAVGGLAGAAAYAVTFLIRRFTLIPPWGLGAGAAGVMGLWLARAPWPSENYAGDSVAVTLAGCVALSCLAASAWRGPRPPRN